MNTKKQRVIVSVIV